MDLSRPAAAAGELLAASGTTMAAAMSVIMRANTASLALLFRATNKCFTLDNLCMLELPIKKMKQT
jgi:hypothetical protein